MIQGRFGDTGELLFEIDLIGIDGLVLTVDAILDTGFTDWLAINSQDAESLGWQLIRQQIKQTASGARQFNLYNGQVAFDGIEKNIDVVGGEEIFEVLIGLKWLDTLKLTVDKKADLLTLE